MVGSITPSITVNASLSPLDASPTLPSLCKISNGTLTLKCSGLEDTFTFAGGQGTKILINTNTKTISFISALVNDTSPQSITCPLNEFVNAYNNVTRSFSCTTVSGAGILQLNGDSQANQFINSANTNHIVVLDSGNTHSIDIAFKINNASCAAGYFITSFNNVTGNYSCATPTSSGITHLNGDGSINQTIGAGQGITVVDAGSIHIVKINFKVNNISCPANYFISSFSNSTGVYSCSVVPVTSAILALDGDSSLSQSLQGTANHIKITDLGNIHTFDIGFKVNNATCSAGFFLTSFNNVTGAYSCSSGNSGTITGIVNVGHGGKGFGAGVSGTNVQVKNLTSTRNDLFTVTANATDVNLSSSFKSDTLSCAAGNAIVSFNNATGTYTCAPFATTDTNTAQLGNSGNGVSLLGTHPNATLNNIKTLRCSSGINCASNSTDIQITSTVTGTVTGSQNAGKATGSVGVLATGTSTTIKGKNVTGTSPIQVTKTNDTDMAVACPTCLVTAIISSQNVGKGTVSTGVLATPTSSTIKGKNVTSLRTDLINVSSSNSTDVNLNSNFKSDSITCVNQFVSAFNNATGLYTCATAGTITGSQNAGKATGSVGTLATATSSTIMGRNFTGIAPVSVTRTNDTDVAVSCSTCLTGTKVDSINSTITGAASINAHDRAIQSSISGSTYQVKTKSNVIIGNDTNSQRIDGHVTIANPQLNGIDMAYVSKTSSYTATGADTVISVDATTTNPTVVTLPSASGNVNQTYWIKKIDYSHNHVKIIGTSSQTIDGFNSYNLTSGLSSIGVISDGSNWKIFDSQGLPSTLFDHTLTTSIIANRGWFTSAITSFTPSTASPTTTTLAVEPFVIPKSSKYDKIQLEVSTLVAGSTCRMGIYSDNGTGYPAYLIGGSDVGTVSGASAGVKTNTFASAITLPAGVYWLANQCSTATTILLRTIPATAIPDIMGELGTMGATSGTGTGWTATNTFGAFPQTYPTSGAAISTAGQVEIQLHRLG